MALGKYEVESITKLHEAIKKGDIWVILPYLRVDVLNLDSLTSEGEVSRD